MKKVSADRISILPQDYSPLSRSFAGNVILDEYILPDEPITDYRTRWSGIRPRDLVGAPSFREVRQRVADAVRGRILIGHALDNDLRALRRSASAPE